MKNLNNTITAELRGKTITVENPDGLELSFNVTFHDDETCMTDNPTTTTGAKALQDCCDHIEMEAGYYEDYKGGTVTIYCEELECEIYCEEIPE